jgi:cytochrome P450
MTTAMQFDPLSRDVQQDPYKYYAALRAISPVCYLEKFGAYALTGYDELRYVTSHPEYFSSADVIKRFFGDLSPVPEVPWLVDMDPPRHHKVRNIIHRAFAKPVSEAFLPRIREIVDGLIEQMLAKDEFDLMHDLAEPLPVIVIGELLGVGSDRYKDLVRWSDDVILATNSPTDPEVIAKIKVSIQEFRAYFLGHIEERRVNPRDDLVSKLIRMHEEEGVLSEHDVLAMCAFVLMAGNETTARSIGNTLVALTENPDQMALVRADPDLVPMAVEEGLRYDSPVLASPRRVVQDVSIGDTELKAGEMLMLLWGSANRDPRHYPDPNRFDVRRNPTDNVAFGFSNHFCLGAPLARREATVALRKFLFECPGFERLDTHTEWYPSPLVRGPLDLPMRWVR